MSWQKLKGLLGVLKNERVKTRVCQRDFGQTNEQQRHLNE
jgi:hypothetical protein